MRKITLLLLSVLLLFTAAACGPKAMPNDEQTLEIYVLNAGYGKDWCDALVEAFKEQDWVKEKYPNLNIPTVQYNDVTGFGGSKLSAGPKANTIDLFFDEHGASYADQYFGTERIVADLTEVVYNQPVPGEDILYKDKMLPSIRESSRYITSENMDTEPQYFYTPWYIGMTGINYSVEILDALDIEVPLTSDQWIASMEKIKQLNGSNPAYKKTSSIIQSYDAPNYFEYMTPIWWAQYEGSDGYSDFYSGISGGRYSKKIFEQKGRLYTLEIMEEALSYENGYLDSNSFLQEYIISQSDLLSGNAVYHVGGDWFDREMSTMRAEMEKNGEKVYDIKMMRTPIVSKIVEKTPSITKVAADKNRNADDVLADVIKAVDAGAPANRPEGVTLDDYNIVKAARQVTGALGSFSSAYVPSYATGKEIAFDFLRFCATDIAQEIYIRVTDGASLPFKYDLEANNPELYNSISDYQRTRQDYFSDENLPVDILPMPNQFPLARFGGVSAFAWANVYTTFSAQNNQRTAQAYYDYTIENWTDQRWSEALASAGLQ